MVKPTTQSLTEASSLLSKCTTISFQHSLLELFCSAIPLPTSPFFAPVPAISTENPSESSIICGISPLQVYRIHLDAFLQYYRDLRLLPTCFGISRYRDSRHNGPRSDIPASPFLHQDILQSGHKSSVGQPLVFPTTYQNFSSTGHPLHRTVGAASCPLLVQSQKSILQYRL
jgi:hypothetical protein